jgi:hypothetical protein
VVHGEDDPHAVELGRGRGVLQRLELAPGRRGLARRPDRRDPNGVEAGEAREVELRLGVERVDALRTVIGCTQEQVRAAERGGREGERRERAQEEWEDSETNERSEGVALTPGRGAGWYAMRRPTSSLDLRATRSRALS